MAEPVTRLAEERPVAAGRRPEEPGEVPGARTPVSVIVSTVKASDRGDRAARRAATSRAGADHVFLCVDDADPEVCARWDGNPHVTAVPTDAAYWGDERSDRLARRQGINANLVNLALTMVSERPAGCSPSTPTSACTSTASVLLGSRRLRANGSCA